MTRRKKKKKPKPVLLLAVLATKHPVIVCEVSHDLFIYSFGQSKPNALNFIQEQQALRMSCKHLLPEQGALFAAANRTVARVVASKTQNRLRRSLPGLSRLVEREREIIPFYI